MYKKIYTHTNFVYNMYKLCIRYVQTLYTKYANFVDVRIKNNKKNTSCVYVYKYTNLRYERVYKVSIHIYKLYIRRIQSFYTYVYKLYIHVYKLCIHIYKKFVYVYVKNRKGKKGKKKKRKENRKGETEQGKKKGKSRGPTLRTRCRRGPLRARHVPRRAGGRARD